MQAAAELGDHYVDTLDPAGVAGSILQPAEGTSAMRSQLCRVEMLVRWGLVTVALAFGERRAWGQEPAYGIVAQKNVMVPMRDGVKLATDIYLPARNGAAVESRFPVVLSRTPYGKVGSLGDAKYCVPCGYAVVSQDTRGDRGTVLKVSQV